jgi:hypothetical protein
MNRPRTTTEARFLAMITQAAGASKGSLLETSWYMMTPRA